MSEFVLNDEISKDLKYIADDVNKKLKDYSAEDNELVSGATAALYTGQNFGAGWETFVKTLIPFLYLADKDKYSLSGVDIQESFSIGCRNISDIVKGFLQIEVSDTKDLENLDSNVKYNIISYLNTELKLTEYIDNKVYLNDIKLMKTVIGKKLEELDSEYNENVLRDIIENEIPPIQDQFSTTLSRIMNIMESFYSNTFSLYPYQAVFSFLGGITTGSGANRRRKSLECIKVAKRKTITYNFNIIDYTESLYYDKLANVLKKQAEISNVSFIKQKGIKLNYTSRNYNIEDILNLEDGEIIYYPLEVFAIATGSLLEVRNDNMFKTAGVNSFTAYKPVLESYISDLLAKYIYKAMEKLGSTIEVRSIKKDNATEEESEEDEELTEEVRTAISFTSSDFVTAYSEIETEDDKARIYSNYVNDIMSALIVKLNTFIKCVCSAFVVSRNDDNTLFKIKVIDFNDKFTPDFTNILFSDTQFTQNAEKIEYPSGVVNNVEGYNIYEYSFCKDIDLMDKKPLFGYTAARLFQKQGLQISVDNILLGEDQTGTPVFASSGNVIDLSSKLVHRFCAGSRSGKGVMTMNLLASSLASENAVFYIDRKPDIGSCLASISNGSMFVVDGGDTSSAEDTFNTFNPSVSSDGNMLNKYIATDKSHFKRSYLTKAFGANFGDTYAGAYGDMVYLKAIMLVTGIIGARIFFLKNAGSLIPEGQTDLQMEKRVTLVIDEVTNWHNNFEDAYFCTDAKSSLKDKSILVKYYTPSLGADIANSSLTGVADSLEKDNKALFEAKQKAYEDAKAAWEENKTDAKLLKAFETAKNSLEKTLNTLSKAQAKKGDPAELLTKLYWTTVMDKYKSVITQLGSIANAGIQPKMKTDNDVILIGQSINGYANLGDPITFNKDATINQQLPDAKVVLTDTLGADRTRSYLFGFAECFGGCDWFIGRNIHDKSKPESDRYKLFGGWTEKGEFLGKELDSWLHTRGNWAYVPEGSQEVYRQAGEAGVPVNPYPFKPYLVLNSNDEMSGGEITNTEDNSDTYKGTPYTEQQAKNHSGDKYKYVYGAADRVGFKDWEKLRLEHIKSDYKPTSSDKCYGHLEDGIGLKGLIEEYKRTNPKFATAEFDSSWLSTSGDMANLIVSRVTRGRFTNYLDYLYDMSPDALICMDDIVLAYSADTANLSDDDMLKRRFSRYANTNNMALLKSTSDSDLSTSSGDSSTSDEDFDAVGKPDGEIIEEAGDNNAGVGNNQETPPVPPQPAQPTPSNNLGWIDEINNPKKEEKPQEEPKNPTIYDGDEDEEKEPSLQETEGEFWSDEDRLEMAKLLLAVYNEGAKLSPQWNKINHETAQAKLLEVMLSLLIKHGF